MKLVIGLDGKNVCLLLHSLRHFSALFIVFFSRLACSEGNGDEEENKQEVGNTNGKDDVDEGSDRHVPALGQGDAPYFDDGKESNEHDKQHDAPYYGFDIFHCLASLYVYKYMI